MRREQIRTFSEAQVVTEQGDNLSQSLLRTTRSYRKLQKRIGKKKSKRSGRAGNTRATTDASSSSQPCQHQIHSELEPVTASSLQIEQIIGSALAVNEVAQSFGQMAGYLDSITVHLLEKERLFAVPAPNYSAHFGQVQKLRLIGLMGVQCMRLNLRVQTQFLAIDIFHRICTAPAFQRYHSALKAASALYVAAKYEQVCAPKAMLFCGVDPGQQVLAQNIVKLEGLILLHLDFNLGFATSLHFAQLLALRFGLQGQQRMRLLGLCRLGVEREQLWVGRGSLLAMAGLVLVAGEVAEWGRSAELCLELEWRVRALRELVG